MILSFAILALSGFIFGYQIGNGRGFEEGRSFQNKQNLEFVRVQNFPALTADYRTAKRAPRRRSKRR
jgi:hypothetical protein